MKYIKFIALLLVFLALTACATGKSIKNIDDIADDGKRNTVLLTYDIKLQVPNKHGKVSSATLNFQCPKTDSKLGRKCFGITLPYLGTKEVDGFGLHAFEDSGARPLTMKYGDYEIQSVSYSVVVDRIPEERCHYDKKKRREICNTYMKDITESYKDQFPSPISFDVSSGTGCYLGHLDLTVNAGEIVDFNLDTTSTVTSGRLSSLSDDMSAALQQRVDRGCRLPAST